MYKFLTILFLLVSPILYGQTFIDDSNFQEKINQRSAFGDDETTIVVVEFWVEFNKANAFSEWDKLTNVKYYRVDIEKAPNAKKKYRIRMAPSVLIFKNGTLEESFKAGLDLELPADLSEIQEAIDDALEASRF